MGYDHHKINPVLDQMIQEAGGLRRLAERAHLSHSHLIAIRSGRVVPRLDTLSRLAEASPAYGADLLRAAGLGLLAGGRIEGHAPDSEASDIYIGRKPSYPLAEATLHTETPRVSITPQQAAGGVYTAETDEMAPFIFSGDHVAVWPHRTPEDGDIVLIARGPTTRLRVWRAFGRSVLLTTVDSRVMERRDRSDRLVGVIGDLYRPGPQRFRRSGE